MYSAPDWKPLTPRLRGPAYHGARLGLHGRYVLAPGVDHVARLWDLAGQAPTLPHVAGRASVARYSPDGRRLLLGTRNDGLRILDTATGRTVAPVVFAPAGLNDAAFSPDGRRLVLACVGWTARLWDAESGLGPALTHHAPVMRAFFDRTGERVITATAQADNQGHADVHVWDVHTHKLLWQSQRGIVESIVLSPDGRQLSAAFRYDPALVWDLATGTPLTTSLKHDYWVRSPTFNPMQPEIATCGGDSTVRVWQLPSGQQRLALRHPQPIAVAAFSPDGKRLATGDHAGAVRIWDADGNVLPLPDMLLDQQVSALAFSPDGRHLLAGSTNGSVQAWDTRTGERLGAAWKAADTIRELAFRPDGRQFAMYDWCLSAHVHDFTAPERAAEDWLLLAQVQAGSRADKIGGVVRLTAPEADDAWQRLRRRAPGETSVPKAQVRSWYLAEAARRAHTPADALAVLAPRSPNSPRTPTCSSSAARRLVEPSNWTAPRTTCTRRKRRAVEFDTKGAVAVALNELGEAFAAARRWPEAVAAHRRVIEFVPTSAEAYNDLGYALRNQRKLPEAAAALQKALELSPRFLRAYLNLSDVLHDQRKLPEALTAYQKAIELDPGLACAPRQYGGILS